jgi:isopenicillin-N N-acyltransferase-like protein
MDTDSKPQPEQQNAPVHSDPESFPFIDLAGTPAEVGRSYGRQAGDYIHRSVAIYQNAFALKGVSWDRARQVAREYAPLIARYDQDFHQELTAIAQGADLPFEDLVAINARTELLYAQKPAPAGSDEDMDGCTAALALPEATASGHTLHGQNWDWRDECADSSVILRITPREGPRMLIFVEAGILARCGLNSDGIAITGNFLQTDDEYGHQGVPVPCIRRKVLRSRALGQAIRVVFDAPRTFSNNLMISQCDGEAVNLEATPNEIFWSLPERGLIVHANHFTSQGALAKVRDVGLETNTDSLYRDRRVRARLSRNIGTLEVADFQEAFADKYGSPRAVCRSPVTGPGGKTSSTVATIVMDTTAKKMCIAKRPYETARFAEYSLD